MKDLYGQSITVGCRVICYAHTAHGTGTVVAVLAAKGLVAVRLDTGSTLNISRVDLEVK